MTQNFKARSRNINRRAAMGRAAMIGVALGASTGLRRAGAQDMSLADHPLTGMWLAMANPSLLEDPQFPAPSLFGADGTVVLIMPSAGKGPDGIEFASDLVGVWEAETDRRGHFTAVQTLSGADGALIGSVTVDGHPEVSEDGQSFVDDGSLVTVTVRDPMGAIVFQGPGGTERPVTARRMTPGSPGFPEDAGAAGTPTG